MSQFRIVALAALLVMSLSIAGCGGKDEPEPTPTTSSTPSPTNSTTPTTSAPPPPPPDPPSTLVEAEEFTYAVNGNTDNASFTVPSGALRLGVNFTVTTNGAGPYSVQGPGSPPSGDPSVTLYDANDTAQRLTFDPVSGGVATEAGDEVRDPVETFADLTGTGSWKVGIQGSGQNVKVTVTIVAYFTEA